MIQTGPILQFLGCRDGVWGVSLLIVCDTGDAQPTLRLKGPAELVGGWSGPVPGLAATAWRFDLAVKQTASAQVVDYRVAGLENRFQVPAQGSMPAIGYLSCNGFSDARARKNTREPNAMWERLDRLHAGLDTTDPHRAGPLELLLMGGDQIYSDEMWSTIAELRDWAGLDWHTRSTLPLTDSLRAALQEHFARCYLERWSQPATARLLASVPSVMMWDDHDIMDGWGSHPAELHDSPVFQGIFAAARSAFELFQRQMFGAPPPATLPGQPAHNSTYQFGDTALLVLDTRSERQPAHQVAGTDGATEQRAEQVMGPASRAAVLGWLDQQLETGGLRHLLVMSSIPVMHPGYAQLEKMLGALPAIEDLEDDLRDHWTSPAHRAERLQLVQRLLEAARAGVRITILSGDVHVAALATIEHDGPDQPLPTRSLLQLTASGITHPAPPGAARYFLEQACLETETLAPGITGRMEVLPGTGRHILGCRNFLTLQSDPPGGSRRLWARWWAEGEPQPMTLEILPAR